MGLTLIPLSVHGDVGDMTITNVMTHPWVVSNNYEKYHGSGEILLAQGLWLYVQCDLDL